MLPDLQGHACLMREFAHISPSPGLGRVPVVSMQEQRAPLYLLTLFDGRIVTFG